MKGEGFKIRLRHRSGYVKEAGGYSSWSEYQVVAGRRIAARYETLDSAIKDYPGAELDISVTQHQER